jgi:hypothetical protein
MPNNLVLLIVSWHFYSTRIASLPSIYLLLLHTLDTPPNGNEQMIFKITERAGLGPTTKKTQKFSDF